MARFCGVIYKFEYKDTVKPMISWEDHPLLPFKCDNPRQMVSQENLVNLIKIGLSPLKYISLDMGYRSLTIYLQQYFCYIVVVSFIVGGIQSTWGNHQPVASHWQILKHQILLMERRTWYVIMKSSLSVTCGRSMVFSEYYGFLHQ